MGKLKQKARSIARMIVNRAVLPLLRPVVSHVVFNDLLKDPLQLEYIKVRTDLLSKYNELFPGAVKCKTRFDVLDAAINEIQGVGIRGLWVEFGVWTGASINYIAQHTGETVYGFDSFEGLPTDWKQGIDDQAVKKEFFAVKSLPKVRQNVRLIKGWFDKTLPQFLEQHKDNAALLHIDSDLYQSAKTILSEMGNRITRGTVLVFDEFFNFPNWEENEYKAFHEFARGRNLQYRFLAFNPYGEQAALVIL